MKQLLQPRSQVLREASCATYDSPLSAAKSRPSPLSSRKIHSANKHSKENCPPPHPPIPHPPDLNSLSPSPASKMKCSLPPRPPASNALKRKLCLETASISSFVDSGVQVIVRMRPLNKLEEDGEMTLQKISDHSVSISGHSFTFDAVADTNSTQEDVFKLVGVHLVENCLAGFNSSIFAYGQTGSGKTYTMWGPANALSEDNLASEQHGLTPRVFQRLFSRIDEEQAKHIDRQLNYQCRCSFLEIYNEQITDLLDPSQKNLQIREDVKSGVYVESLREEYVFSMKDVMRLLVKGLSNRRTGATSINAESSRSHSVFTCVVESRCKRKEDGVVSLKISRINLVDLAGSERQKLTGAGGERLKEAGNINRSLSQLGNLINILAEVSQSGKQRHIPYRDSRLTFLLQESLGGNAKLAMLCAVSPAFSCKSESFSTLRFAQRAKAIRNKAVVNEEMEDDVNHLRTIIRQLRDELNLMKANGNNVSGWNPRTSLKLLKSLVSPRTRLQDVDEDGDEEMEIDEEAVEDLSNDLDSQGGLVVINEDSLLDRVNHSENPAGALEEEIPEQAVTKDIRVCGEVGRTHVSSGSGESQVPQESTTRNADVSGSNSNLATKATSFDLSIPANEVSTILKSPNHSVSPNTDGSRKSQRTLSMLTASQASLHNEKIDCRLDIDEKWDESIRASVCLPDMRKRKTTFGQTDRLAASLHRGLEIFENHRRSVALRKSSFMFPIKPLDSKPATLVRKVDAGVQTVSPDESVIHDSSYSFLCVNCKEHAQVKFEDGDDPHIRSATADEQDTIVKSKVKVPIAVEKVLAGAIRREMTLEEVCATQASEIVHLNRLVQQYERERECNSKIGQTLEDKVRRLENLIDGVLPTEHYLDEELNSLTQENQLLKVKCENHPEITRVKIDLKRAQEELEQYKNFHELGEKEVLLEEIQDLRSQLIYYLESSSISRKRSPNLQLEGACESFPCDTVQEGNQCNYEGTLEQERLLWTEKESKWISMANEMRTELDTTRNIAEKQKRELETEKKCGDELREALQMAMQVHARMLEQYADLEVKHIDLLARHRMIQEGIDDVKKAASKAGVKGAELKFINALAAEIAALKSEREKERRYFRDENRGLQVQLRDTEEAVHAAGELLVRLREAEDAVCTAQRRVMDAEQAEAKALDQMEAMRRQHELEICALKAVLPQPQVPNDTIRSCEIAKYDECAAADEGDHYRGDDFMLSKLADPSTWSPAYDQCNL